MRSSHPLCVLALALLGVPCHLAPGQGCEGNGFASFDAPAAVLGTPYTPTLVGAPNAPLIWYVDAAPGVVTIPGAGTACIALTPAAFPIVDGVAQPGGNLPASGTWNPTLLLPGTSSLYGTAVYSQFAVVDPSAPAGLALSNPRSALFTQPDSYIPTLGNLASFGTALHRATAFGGGRYVLVSGGGPGTLIAPTPTSQTEIYDSYTHTFLPGPAMSRPRVLHSATRLNDGRILIAGGLDGTAPMNWDDAEVFDPATGTFTPVSNTMSTPRAVHTANLLPDGRVLICGGNTIFAFQALGNYLQIFQSAQGSVDIYDPNLNAFVPGPPMAEARVGHNSVTLPNGRVMVAGGISGGVAAGPFAFPTYAAAAEVFDPTTGAWSSAGNISEDRFVGVMEVLPSGAVFFAAGATGPLLSSSNTADYWTAGAWTPSPINLPQDAALAASMVLADGTVAISGGGQGSVAQFAAITQVVRFSETTFSFIPTTSLPVGLMNHSMTPLPDGTILLVGGVDPAGNAQTQAFAWNP